MLFFSKNTPAEKCINSVQCTKHRNTRPEQMKMFFANLHTPD